MAFLFVAAALIAVDNIYALFGHGVRSAAMSNMFFYPMLGAAVHLVLGIAMPQAARSRRYRMFCNLFHSGIATLAAAGMLQGILEIAGTASGYVLWFVLAGWMFVAASAAVLWKPRGRV